MNDERTFVAKWGGHRLALASKRHNSQTIFRAVTVYEDGQIELEFRVD